MSELEIQKIRDEFETWLFVMSDTLDEFVVFFKDRSDAKIFMEIQIKA